MHPIARSATSSHLQTLQVLRGLAAASVVYCHIGASTTFGIFGVDLFFVLSGFVIAMASEKNIGAMQFAISRITRVAPLYWLMTTGIMLVAILSPESLKSTTASIPNYLKSIFFIPYFKESGVIQPMLFVGWTLNYEMLFYAMGCVALAINPSRFFYTTSALMVFAFGVGYLLPDGMAYAEFLRSNLLFEFMLGMAAFKLKDSALLRKMPAWLIAILILSIYVSMALCEIRGLGNRFIEFGIPSFLIVLLAIQLEPLFPKLNSIVARTLVHIGNASYATYLSHVFAVQLLRKLLPRFTNGLTIESPVGVAIAISFSLVVGGLIYVLLDKPSVALSKKAFSALSKAAPKSCWRSHPSGD